MDSKILQKPYLLLLLLSLLGYSRGDAQWEQVGWEYETYPQYQLGNTSFRTFTHLSRSTDFGNTWSPFTDGLPLSTFSIPDGLKKSLDGKFLYFFSTSSKKNLYEPGIYYCKENDSKWSFKKFALMDGTWPTGIDILSIDSFGYINKTTDSTAEIYLSVDGGTTWGHKQTILPTGHAQYNLYFSYKSNTGYIQIENFDTVNHKFSYSNYRTTNGGQSWVEILLPDSTSASGSLQILSDSIWLFRVYDNVKSGTILIRSTNYGATWATITLDSISDTAEYSVQNLFHIDNKYVLTIQKVFDYKTGYQQYSFLSLDEGEHWKTLTIPDSSGISFLTKFYAGYFATTQKNSYIIDSTITTFTKKSYPPGTLKDIKYITGSDLYTAEQRSTLIPSYTDSIIHSSNNGLSWSKYQFRLGYKPSKVSWIEAHSRLLTLGTEKSSSNIGLLSSLDAGLTWNVVSIIAYPNLYPDQLIVLGDTIFVLGVTSDLNNISKLFRSLDGGAHWDTIGYPFGINPYSIDYYRGWLILHSSAWKASSDLGQTWIDVGASLNLPSKRIGDIWFSSSTNASTFINTLSRSTDFGFTWTNCQGLPSNFSINPTYSEKNIYYGIGISSDNINDTAGEGRNAVFISLDSGNTWKGTTGYFINAGSLFSGSDYFFAAGYEYLWRLPKSSLSSVHPTKPPTSSNVAFNNCYPNPATTQATVSYSIPNRSPVRITASDITGRTVAILSDETQESGVHSIEWNTSSLSSGSYILTLSACGERVSKIMLVSK